MSHRWIWACGFGNLRFKSDRWVCADCNAISEGNETGYTGDLLKDPPCAEPKHAVDPAIFQDFNMMPIREPTWTKERPTTPGWYWLWHRRSKVKPELCELFASVDDRVLFAGEEESESVTYLVQTGALWSGPLHPPELPKPEAGT